MLALVKSGFSAAEVLEMSEAEADAYLELLASLRGGGQGGRGGKGKTYVVRRDGNK